MTIHHIVWDSPVGALTMSAESGALTGVYFDAHRHPPRAGRLGLRREGSEVTNEVLGAARDQLQQYFDGVRRVFDLPLAPVGTPFQQRVWMLLRDIDFGATSTYGALAAQLGGPSMARAVGAAVGRNPLSIVVPCHRVLGAAGALTGFAGGLERKRHLLQLEGVACAPVLF